MSATPRKHRWFHYTWTDDDFEQLPADIVIGSAEADRWPDGTVVDVETEQRIANDVAAAFAATTREHGREHRRDAEYEQRVREEAQRVFDNRNTAHQPDPMPW